MASCTRLVRHESVTYKTITQPTVDVSSVGVGDTRSPLPKGWQYAAFAEIFVCGYSDSNGDGVGDLKGLTQRLDYLQSLGVTGIWLMPVNPSEDRDHGYSVTDYRNIEPAYGTPADFDELLQQAHARGIRIVMDYVINHSAAARPLFLNVKSATNNTFRDWYAQQSTASTGWSIFGHDPWHLTQRERISLSFQVRCLISICAIARSSHFIETICAFNSSAASMDFALMRRHISLKMAIRLGWINLKLRANGRNSVNGKPIPKSLYCCAKGPQTRLAMARSWSAIALSRSITTKKLLWPQAAIP